MTVANSASGALGDLGAGHDAWVNTCVNGIGDPVDLSWARRFGLSAAYTFRQALPPAWPGVSRDAFAHESGMHADGALEDRGH